VSKVAYRFLPCDDRGDRRESSQYTKIADASEEFCVGTIFESTVLGHEALEVCGGS